MKKPTRILIVEDVPTDAELAKRAIGKVLKRCEFQVVETRNEFLGALETFQPDVILSDYSLPHFDGMKALKLALKHAPLTPFIIWTGSMSEDIAVDCMKSGANNYILKENIKRLGPAVLHALEERQVLIERRQAEEKYQEIFENSVVGIFQSSPEGRFIHLNAAMARIYGYDSPQEMIEAVKNIPEQIYTDPARRIEFVVLLNSQDTVDHYEQENYRKDGSVIWTSTSARAVRDPNGQVQYYEGFITDITARKSMEKKLQESETEYRTLVEHLPAITYISAPDQYMGVSYISPGIESLGFSTTEWLADPGLWFKQIHPEDQGRVLAELQRFRDGAPTFSAEYRFKTFNGEMRWFHDQSIYVRDRNGTPILKQGFMLDITERKQAEEALRNDGERFRALFEDMPIPIWEEDYSEVKEYLDSLKQLGITDFRAYFKAHPEAVIECSDRIKVLAVNKATLQMYHANDKDDLLEKVNNSLSDGQLDYLQEALISITEGKTSFMWEGADETIKDKTIKVNIVASVIPGYEHDLSKVIVAITDITERKQAEEALRNGEKRFRALIENGLDNISLLTAEGMLIWESPAATRMLGYAPDEFVGQNIFKLMHPDDLDWTVGLYSQLIQEPGSRQQGIFRLRHANGTWRWVEAIVTNMLDEPAVKAIVVNYRDVTEREQTEARINELLDLNAKILNHSPLGILTYKLTGNCIFANEKAASIVGTTVDQLRAQNFYTIEAWKRSGLYDLVEKTIATQTAVTADIHHISTFGKDVWLTAHCVTFRLKEEDHILLSISDISERKQAEERLRESENRYQMATKATNDVVWEANLQTNQLFWSENAQVIFGYTPEEIDPNETWWDDHLHPDDRERVLSKLNGLIAGDESLWSDEYRFLLKDGSYAYISDRGYIERNADGRPLRMIGAMSDITERKQAEEKLIRSQHELAEAQRVAKIGSWNSDVELNIAYWSDELYRIFGVEKETFNPTYDAFINLVHPEDRVQARQINLDTLIEGQPFEVEYRIITPGGEIKTISEISYAVKDNEGKVTNLFGTAQDVTLRKQAEIERHVLLEIMQGLAHTKDLQDFLKLVHHAIAKVIYAENFFVVLYQANTGLFEEIYSVDQYDPPEPPSRLEKSITSYVFRSGEPLLLTQARFDELAAQDEVTLIGTDSKSWLGVPLKTSGRMIGVMAVQDYQNDNRYSEREKDFLVSIATQVALAIERKRTEEALTLFRSQIDYINDTIEVIDPESGRFIDVNEQACRTHGYTREEYLTLTINDIDPIEATRPGPMADKLLRSGSLVFETLHRRKDGSVFPVEVNLTHIRLDRDYNLAVVRDITERKEAEAELKRSHSLLYATLESTADGILVVEPDGRISNFNQKFLELWRIPDSLAAQNDDRILLEFVLSQLKDPPAFLSRVEALYQSPESTSFDEIEFCDGRIFERFSQPQRLGNVIVGRVWSFRDITERKRAEAALMESITHFRTLFEASPDAILLIDPSDTWNIIDCNTAAGQMNGYAREELIGQPVGILNTIPGDPDERVEYIEKIRQQGILRYETAHRRKDGAVIAVDVSTTLIQFGKRDIILGIDRDITERKRTEAAEREQRTLAEALRDTAETLSSTLDYGEVLDHILAAAGRVVPHDAATIMLIDGESAQVVRSQGYDQHPSDGEIMGVSLPLGDTTNLRQMLETRQPVVVYDTYTYPGWVRMSATDWLRSNVGAPISIYGEVIGFVLLDSQAPGFFTPVHAERLEAFANQAALAIHNARLLRQAQEELAERIQAEKELRASEERFRQLADNIQEGFWMTDAETDREIYMSPAVEKIWGQKIESLMHEPNAFINSVFAEDRPRVLQAIEKEKHGESVEIEYRIVQPDGSLRWVWDRAFPISDESGKVRRIAGISADVTERRESELALIQSQSRYRELFDSSPISIWEEDFSQVKQQIDVLLESGIADLNEYFSSHPYKLAELAALVQIIDANQAALNLYGVEKESLLKRLTQILSRDALGHFQQEIIGLISPVRKFEWEGTDRMLNGKQIEVIVTGSIPHGYEDDWSKVIVSVTDITERKRAEEEVRRRAEETSALLETSLALTHLDLKTTLRTISNSAKTLFAADGCRIFLMEPDNETLRCVLALQENFEAFSDLRIKVGEGVTGTVAATGQAEIVNEMHNDPRSVHVPGTPDKEVEAIMFAPLKERGRTIGVLSIRRVGADRFFQPADLELLEAFAAMAASSVSNARLFEETQRRLAELEALYENGLAVGRLLKPSDIGNRVIETFARYLSWHHVTIRLKWDDSDNLELVAFNLPSLKDEERAHAEQHFIAQISKVGQGLSGRVIQTGEPLRTGNVHAHPGYINTHAGIQSGLYMPLKIGERVIGVISVESEVPNAFTDQDERLLATLASQAAIAFENARLYQTIQKELSERRRAEEALRASEAHYRELADSITDILFELDHDLHYTHWNKASEVLTGIPVGGAIGKSMHEIFGESEEQRRIGKIYEDVLKSRQPKTFETTLVVGGAKRSFEINAYPSRRGVSVVAKDVTDRKRSETIMQKRFELMEYSAHHTLNELMQRTVDEVSELTGSTIGFFHFVEADQLNLGMQTWSTNALQLFNVPPVEGTHLPLDKAGVWAEAVRQRRPLIQNDYTSLAHTRGLPQGHFPVLREIVIPIIRSDKVVAVMGIGNKPQDYTVHDLEIAERLADYAWDITERKQMEIALEVERNQLARRVEERTADLSRANSNLARALRVKDEFLANMSHELRTPLNAILGLSESLGEQIAGPLNEKQQKYITTISESGHHLLSLINDILDLAKIEAGQITLDINKVDIHSVCQASLRMIKQLAQKKSQEVTLTIKDGLGLMWADERRLKQMIVNLLGNAVKFTPENGRIGLEVHGDQEANKITITVWDNGIGISGDDLARLFQPFVQVDSGLARETTGTGLGLALVAQMARLHGGSVQAFSEPGVGSRFSIILPWEPALALDSATRLRITGKFRAIRPDETKKPTILLVEDTKEVIMMIQDYLELAGYRIVTAQDGIDAIVQAKLIHPDLILMDIQMPRMDGLEATRKLRAEPDFRYTPIVALTALAMPSDRERCLAAGMDEYISKPINLKALVRIIQSCLFSSEEMKHQ